LEIFLHLNLEGGGMSSERLDIHCEKRNTVRMTFDRSPGPALPVDCDCPRTGAVPGDFRNSGIFLNSGRAHEAHEESPSFQWLRHFSGIFMRNCFLDRGTVCRALKTGNRYQTPCVLGIEGFPPTWETWEAVT